MRRNTQGKISGELVNLKIMGGETPAISIQYGVAEFSGKVKRYDGKAYIHKRTISSYLRSPRKGDVGPDHISFSIALPGNPRIKRTTGILVGSSTTDEYPVAQKILLLKVTDDFSKDWRKIAKATELFCSNQTTRIKRALGNRSELIVDVEYSPKLPEDELRRLLDGGDDDDERIVASGQLVRN